jgi:cytochrome c-type biogenesis protein
MINVSIPIAFAAGAASFFAPCVLPLLPAYVVYITGVSIKGLEKDGYHLYIKRLLSSGLFFVIGFSIVFILLGTAVAGIGASLRRYDVLLQRIGGLIIVILGLEFAGVIHISVLDRGWKLNLPKWAEKFGHLRALLIGVIFATAWTPCVGAILGSILTLAAISGTAVHGALLLLVYSLGISLPFIIVTLTLASVPRYMSALNKYSHVISKVSGIALSLIGLLLLTNTYKYLYTWFFVNFSL